MEPLAHILIVEDDVDLRDVLVDVLANEGFSVQPAGDGREALEYLRTAPRTPDLILLDVMMPGMNGYQFREEQLKVPEHATIPVVVFTANPTASARELAVEHILRKPVAIGDLLATLRRIVQLHSPQP